MFLRHVAHEFRRFWSGQAVFFTTKHIDDVVAVVNPAAGMGPCHSEFYLSLTTRFLDINKQLCLVAI